MKTIFSILILSFIGFVGCQQEDYSPMLSKAERLMNERPDSALQLLRNFRIDNIHGRANKAKYALLYSQALDKNYIDLTNDSLIRIAVDYYQQHGSKIEMAWAIFYHARIFDNAGDIDAAMSSYLEAEIQAKGTKEYYLLGMIYGYKANLFAAQANFDAAIPMYQASIDSYSHIDRKYNLMYAYDGLARSYHIKGDINASLQTLGRTQQLAEELCDTMTILRCVHYHAVTLFENLDNPQAALDLLINTYKEYERPFTFDTFPFLSRLYLEKNDLLNARYYAKEFEKSDLSLLQTVGILAMQKDIELKAQNFNGYTTYCEQYIKLADSLSGVEQKHSLEETIQKYNHQKLVTTNANLAKENKSHWIIIGLSIFLFLLIIFVIYNRLKKRDTLLQEYLNIVEEAKAKCKKLIALHTELNQNNEFLKAQLADKVKILTETLEFAGYYRGNEDNEKFLSKFKKYLQTDEVHNLSIIFRNIIDAKQPGVLVFLKERYPNLTDDDINLYCQVCGGCTVEVLGLVYGVSSKHIYNKRAALRKKLMQQEDEKKTLLDHLTQLIEEFKQNHIISEE